MAEVFETILPWTHSTGRACDDIEPMLLRDSPSSGSDTSLYLWDQSDIMVGYYKSSPEANNFIGASWDQQSEGRKDVESFQKVIVCVSWRDQVFILISNVNTRFGSSHHRSPSRQYPTTWWSRQRGQFKIESCWEVSIWHTLSQEPVIRTFWSPDPGILSQSPRVVTGAVCPLYICKIFPVYVQTSSGIKQTNQSQHTINAHFEVQLLGSTCVLCNPCNAISNSECECFAL